MLAWRKVVIPRAQSGQFVEAFSTSVRFRWSEEDYSLARRWHSNLSDEPLPRIGEVSYARSSGPGGQNVNK